MFFWSEREGNGGPAWWGPLAGANGLGRSDERRYAHNASFMTYFGPASCPATIGSAVLRKTTKKTQQVTLGHLKCPQAPGGTHIQTRLLDDVDPLERAEYDRAVAHDTRENPR